MTLLESIVAFVVLALVGIACLDLSRGAMQLERSSAEWTRAVARGESTMAGALVDGAASVAGANAVDNATVTRRPWRNGTELVEVTVPLQSGGAYRLARVVARGRTSARVASGGAVP